MTKKLKGLCLSFIKWSLTDIIHPTHCMYIYLPVSSLSWNDDCTLLEVTFRMTENQKATRNQHLHSIEVLCNSEIRETYAILSHPINLILHILLLLFLNQFSCRCFRSTTMIPKWQSKEDFEENKCLKRRVRDCWSSMIGLRVSMTKNSDKNKSHLRDFSTYDNVDHSEHCVEWCDFHVARDARDLRWWISFHSLSNSILHKHVEQMRSTMNRKRLNQRSPGEENERSREFLIEEFLGEIVDDWAVDPLMVRDVHSSKEDISSVGNRLIYVENIHYRERLMAVECCSWEDDW